MALQSAGSRILKAVLPLALLGGSVMGFQALGPRSAPPRREQDRSAAVLVQTVPVESATAELPLVVDGLSAPWREVTLAAQISGRVTFRAEQCRPGNVVQQGTVLLEIDPQEYELEARRLQQELEQARTSVNELQVQITNTEESLKISRQEVTLRERETARIRRLADRKVSTDSEVDTALREELMARQNLTTLENQLRLQQAQRPRLDQAVELAQSRLERAELDVTRTKIVAPFDAVVTGQPVEQGSYVRDGTELVTLDDISAAEIRCSLQMDQLDWLWKQQRPHTTLENNGQPPHDIQIPRTPATVIYRLGGREYLWKGVLSRYDGWALDERTRTVPARILVSSPGEFEVRLAGQSEKSAAAGEEPATFTPFAGGPPSLMRGMYVTVRLHTLSDVPLVRLPERAVRPGNTVWQIVDGKLAIRSVTVRQTSGGSVLLDAEASQLTAGDRIIVSPLSSPEPGMAVQDEAAPVQPASLSISSEEKRPASRPAGDAAASAAREGGAA
ncbi:MAG: HlyD family efflux transporter periplasmic adaptor subunit [Planctomycetaceae bacterium]|nr:HlyD family efflux transporter periplasmic adaptor subunit [Planctomycetaceae bacterium]